MRQLKVNESTENQAQFNQIASTVSYLITEYSDLPAIAQSSSATVEVPKLPVVGSSASVKPAKT